MKPSDNPNEQWETAPGAEWGSGRMSEGVTGTTGGKIGSSAAAMQSAQQGAPALPPPAPLPPPPPPVTAGSSSAMQAPLSNLQAEEISFGNEPMMPEVQLPQDARPLGQVTMNSGPAMVYATSDGSVYVLDVGSSTPRLASPEETNELRDLFSQG